MPKITNEVLFTEIKNLKENFEDFKDNVCDDVKTLKSDVKNLTEWKIGFVAKFSVYSSIAIFLGSLVGTLLIKYIDKFLNL